MNLTQFFTLGWFAVVVSFAPRAAQASEPASNPPTALALAEADEFVQSYCMDCHNADDATAGLDLESLSLSEMTTESWPVWELSLKRIASHQMPPPDADRPSDHEFDVASAQFGQVLDAYAHKHLKIPDVATLRRLTRTEYQNAVRDLLAVEIDASQFLPKDESSQGFDNITVGELSPVLIDRYLTAAREISRTAVQRPTGNPTGLTVRLPADLTQEQHLPGLPLGTRGGTKIRHTFAESGQYELSVRLTRDRDEMIEGLFRPHNLDVLVDAQRQHRFLIEPPKNRKDDTQVDANLKTYVSLDAGVREIVVAFADQGESLIEIKRQPFDAAYNRHRHPRQQPALFEVSIVGPLNNHVDATKEPSDAQSERERLSVGRSGSREDLRPTTLLSEALRAFRNAKDQRSQTTRLNAPDLEKQLSLARKILTPIARRAFRREVSEQDLRTAMNFVTETLQTRTTPPSATTDQQNPWQDRFALAIERGLASILVNPRFLFRIERSTTSDSDEPTLISSEELASRLAFFLWSSLPDEHLLDLARDDSLRDPIVLQQEVSRMLSDERSDSLVTNFASQWLYLRNLDGVKPDLRRFPDYDENLRRACRKETQHFVRDCFRQNHSVLKLIRSDATFLNERLARHYDIAGVRGSHFRKVTLPPESMRGGLLRHASILSVTSYSTRTSPTIRGNWVLENIIGTPPPPPPPDVPTLKEKSTLTAVTFRERLAMHRQNDSCAACHALIDPVGFSLDHFDAVGRLRAYDGDTPIDASGQLPDGTEVNSVQDLEQSILDHPEMFVSCLTEKLLTYGLGRGVDHRDAYAVRQIVREAEGDQYRFVDLIQAIVASKPFRYR